MSDTGLTCADCLVDPCGNPFPVNGDGCMVVPSSAVVPGTDGTATWAWVDGVGNFRTAALVGPDPAGLAKNVLRGNGYAAENNADMLTVNNTPVVTNLLSFFPGTGNTSTQQVGLWSYTNGTGDERLYVATVSLWQAVQSSVAGVVNLDFYNGLRWKLDTGAITDGGWAGQAYAGTPGSGGWLKTRDQLTASALVPAGSTIVFTAWAQLFYSGTFTAAAWSATTSNVYVYSINHTGA